MLNVKLTLAYDGTHYHGFQRQNNAISIQEVLEKTLQKLYNQDVPVIGSGRTDSGVHARGQVVNYYAPFEIPVGRIPYALNSMLPDDIRIIEASIVSREFHSRFDARSKIYSYTVDQGEFHSVFNRLYSYHLPISLNVKAMEQAASHFLGRHEFSAFCSSKSCVKDRNREIKKAYWEEQGELLRFTIEADGFLYNMVRIIVGTLLETGQGRIQPEDIPGIIASRNRKAAGPTVPARGLCLEKVFY